MAKFSRKLLKLRSDIHMLERLVEDLEAANRWPDMQAKARAAIAEKRKALNAMRAKVQ